MVVKEKTDRSFLLLGERYIQIVKKTKEALQKRKGRELTSKQYRRLKRYDILTVCCVQGPSKNLLNVIA